MRTKLHPLAGKVIKSRDEMSGYLYVVSGDDLILEVVDLETKRSAFMYETKRDFSELEIWTLSGFILHRLRGKRDRSASGLVNDNYGDTQMLKEAGKIKGLNQAIQLVSTIDDKMKSLSNMSWIPAAFRDLVGNKKQRRHCCCCCGRHCEDEGGKNDS